MTEEVTSPTKEAAPSASGRGMVAEDQIAQAIKKARLDFLATGRDRASQAWYADVAQAVLALLATAPAPVQTEESK